MKKIENILILIIAVLIALHFLFPNEVIKREEILIPGDTITTVINQKKFDSLEYHFKAEIQKLQKSKIVYRIGKTDTIKDTVYLSYSSKFDLGDSSLGTSGIVAFDFEEFSFDSIKYRYPLKIKEITDTLKIYSETKKPFYFDEWFYTSLALFLLLISSLSG